MDNLAGRPVYGGGSFAPNRGRVDPRGYMLRELRKRGLQKGNQGRHLGWYKNGKIQGTATPIKKPMQPNGPYGGVSQIGGDGQSDTRAGIAKSMLANQLGTASVSHTAVRPDGSKTQISFQPGKPVPEQSGKQVSFQPGKPVLGADGKPIPSPASQVVNINANGTLDLPYNQEFAEGVLQYKDQLNQQLMDLQAEEQSENMEYAQNTRQAGIDFQDLMRQTLNRNAGSGTAFSSAYGTQAGNNARDHNNMMNDLLGQHNLFGQQAATQRTSAVASLQDYIRRAAQAYADQLSEQKGHLGYGTSTQTGTSPSKKRRKKRRQTFSSGGPR